MLHILLSLYISTMNTNRYAFILCFGDVSFLNECVTCITAVLPWNAGTLGIGLTVATIFTC